MYPVRQPLLATLSGVSKSKKRRERKENKNLLVPLYKRLSPSSERSRKDLLKKRKREADRHLCGNLRELQLRISLKKPWLRKKSLCKIIKKIKSIEINQRLKRDKK